MHSNYKIQDDALNHIEEKFNQNLKNLPMVQLLMKKIQLAYPHQDSEEYTELTLSNVRKIGDLESLVEKDLDQYFNQLPIFDQQVFELFFRNITQPGDGLAMKKPRTLQEIIDVVGIDKTELIRVITDLKNSQPGIIDVIEPYQKNVTHFKEAYISDTAVINLSNNYLIRNWPILLRWIAEEKESADTYVRLSESAKLFQLDQTGYLRPPDLDLVMAWFDRVQPKKIWADQFNPHYRMSIDYLLKSNETYLEELELKEAARKEVLRKARKTQIIFASLMGLGFFIALIAGYLGQVANREKERAKISAENAEIAKKSALNAAQEAAKQKEKALASAKVAKANEDKAAASAIVALKAQKDAEIERQNAIQAANAAKRNSILAKENEIRAIGETKKAQEASDEAKKARQSESELKEYEVAQKKILALTNKLNYEKFDGEAANLEFVNEVIVAYKNLDSLSQKINNGKVLPDNALFRLLSETEYRIVENKPKIIESNNYVVDKSNKGGLRAIDSYQKNKIIAAGDDHILINYSLSGNVQPIPTKKNIRRIRAVKFIDENNVVFTNVTGEIYTINLTTQEEKLIKSFNSDQPINDLVVSNEKIFTSFNGSLLQIGVKNYESKILPLKNVEQLYELNEEKFFAKTSQGLFLINSKSLEIQPVVLAPLNGQLPNISSIIVSTNKVFLGTDDGKIWVYDNPKGTFQNLRNPWYISAHRSRVTALEYDNKTGQLFTASLDKTSKIYDFSIDDRSKLQERAIKLEGFEKWIWDFVLISRENTDPLLFTVDEKGMLMKWNTRASDIFKKIDSWNNQKSRKK
jgi:WD40 repeat protein